MSKADLHDRLAYALAWIRGRTDAQPRAGIVLGSGLGGVAAGLSDAVTIPYEQIPEFPSRGWPATPGGWWWATSRGRGGRSRWPCCRGACTATRAGARRTWPFGARTLCLLGARVLVVTNASGGVNPALGPGDLVRIEDHLNLSGQNPLAGRNDDRLGPRFPDLTYAYDPKLGASLDATAVRLGIRLERGVYACMAGPSYETPAEIRMLRALGADLVGMSTVPEVIAARHMGVPVVGVSLVTNRAAGLAGKPLSHAEVAAVASREGARLGTLLATFLGELEV